MKWYHIKSPGVMAEVLVRLDQVVRVEANVTQEYVYVILHQENGFKDMFTMQPEDYPKLLNSLG